MNWKVWLGPLLLLFALLTVFQQKTDHEPARAIEQGAGDIFRAFDQQRSGVWVNFEAMVIKMLRDDVKGSRHQRFIVRLSPQHTVLVSHNIDLAAKIPIRVNDRLMIRGRYEWNAKGGVIHWTHHDPEGEIDGGWIILEGVKYY